MVLGMDPQETYEIHAQWGGGMGWGLVLLKDSLHLSPDPEDQDDGEERDQEDYDRVCHVGYPRGVHSENR